MEPDGSVVQFGYSDVLLYKDLSWTIKTTSLAKKANQRLYFLHKLRKARAPAPIMSTFHRGTIRERPDQQHHRVLRCLLRVLQEDPPVHPQRQHLSMTVATSCVTIWTLSARELGSSSSIYLVQLKMQEEESNNCDAALKTAEDQAKTDHLQWQQENMCMMEKMEESESLLTVRLDEH
ncbi:hypothetical protein L3Q82_005623 [Scortum barcoo]|uniref:Uncharacterized protein n=1 Tax=Scortum barcoo TaxID=214431 RepID=A0ACB8V7W2_9TELE|nr:hypothetical protein L3Q82_005623 [Scortum barcoo]